MKEELLFHIRRIPTFELVDVFVRDGALVKQPHLRAIVEQGKNDAIAVVSDKYNLVQIKDLFENVVECCRSEVDGEVFYYRGKGDLCVFPEDSDVGLLVQNSVDLSSAVRISFCTRTKNGIFSIPSEVASPFVRIHTAREIQVQIEHYLALLDRVKPAWEQIVEHLAALELNHEDIEALKRDIGAGKRLSEIIDEYLDPEQDTFAPIKFWDFIQIVVKAIEKRNYKTTFHLSRKIRKVGDAILQWAVFEKLRLSAVTMQ
ncbi:MAG: hypothetical protein H5T49_04610 [Hadesarchaea archaeon]|nr:hypothetical protein [Hadesarchaea archaeon]